MKAQQGQENITSVAQISEFLHQQEQILTANLTFVNVGGKKETENWHHRNETLPRVSILTGKSPFKAKLKHFVINEMIDRCLQTNLLTKAHTFVQ